MRLDDLLAWHRAPSELRFDAFPTASPKKSAFERARLERRGERGSIAAYRRVTTSAAFVRHGDVAISHTLLTRHFCTCSKRRGLEV